MSSRPRTPVVLALFFGSGAAALIYEVVWTREFTYVFGGSAHAVATVLAAFMAGLALGSVLLGRWIDRRGHPLRVYALLEAAIGAFALLLPLLLSGLDGLYGAVHRALHPGLPALTVLRFVLSFLLLLIPTTLMGGTLPVLGRLLIDPRHGRGERAGLLYAVNTLGAVVGVAGAGFVLLPSMGLTGATLVAVAMNATVAALAFLMARRTAFSRRAATDAQTGAAAPAGIAPPTDAAADDTPRHDLLRRAVWLAYGLSGCAALAYEVAWTKALSLVLGSTTYAFSAMLTTFLLGLGVGSFVLGRVADRLRRPEGLLVLVQLLIPVTALATVPWMERLPQVFLDAFPGIRDSWTLIGLYRLVLAGSVLLVPTFLMGGMFPLAARAYVDRKHLGLDLGTLLAANTTGAILGSALAGFVLIPALGRQSTLLAASVVNVLAALLIAAAAGRRAAAGPFRFALPAAALLLVPAWLVAVPRWDPGTMASGVYVYAARMTSVKEEMAKNNLVLQVEDAEAITTVWQSGAVRSLRINGKADAASHGDMVTQMLLGHLPGFYRNRDGGRGLVIGLATGVSSAALLTHGLEQVETCELLPGMPRATRLFAAYNRNVLDDRRHRVVLNDGRNHLLLSETPYDVVVSEPTNPEVAGVGALFTREFFDLAKRRMAPDGVLCQWTQLYHYRPDDVRALLGTIREVFPYVHVWEGSTSDLLIVASAAPLRMDLQRLTDALQGPVGEDLARVEILPLPQLLAYFVTDEKGVDAFVDGYPRRVTDGNLLLEYAAPRNVFAREGGVTALDLVPHARPVFPYLEGAPPDLAGEIAHFREAHLLALRGYYLGAGTSFTGASRDHLERALAVDPREALARSILGNVLVQEGTRALTAGRHEEAIRVLERAYTVGDRLNRALALSNLGSAAFRSGDMDRAEALWRRAAETERLPEASYNLAMVAARRARVDEMFRRLDEALSLDPGNAPAWSQLAYQLALTSRNPERALEAARRSVDLAPEPRHRAVLGYVLVQRKQWKDAERVLAALLREHPDSLDGLLYLGQARVGLGKREEARSAFERVAREAQGQEIGRRAAEELRRL